MTRLQKHSPYHSPTQRRIAPRRCHSHNLYFRALQRQSQRKRIVHVVSDIRIQNNFRLWRRTSRSSRIRLADTRHATDRQKSNRRQQTPKRPFATARTLHFSLSFLSPSFLPRLHARIPAGTLSIELSWL